MICIGDPFFSKLTCCDEHYFLGKRLYDFQSILSSFSEQYELIRGTSEKRKGKELGHILPLC